MYILKEILYLQSNISKVAGAEELSLQSNNSLCIVSYINRVGARG